MSSTDEADGLSVFRPHYGCEYGACRGWGAGSLPPRRRFLRARPGGWGRAAAGPRGPGRAGAEARGVRAARLPAAPLGVRGGGGGRGTQAASTLSPLRLEGLAPRPSPSSAEIAGRPRLRWRSTVQGVSRGRDRAPRASWGAVPQRCRRGGPGPTWPALGRSVSFLRRGGLVRISNVTTRGSPRAPHFPVSPAGGVVPRAEGEPFGVLRFPMSFCARSGVEFLDDFTHQQLSVRHCVRLVELKVRPSPCLQRAF